VPEPELAIEDLALAAAMKADIPEAADKIYRLQYMDSQGTPTDRKIRIIKIELNDNPSNSYLWAYCYTAMDRRQFRFDRIEALYDGYKKIQNPQQFLISIHQASPEYKIEKTLEEHNDEILLLVFFSRADGIM
jgi:predicted DNA-binding transcriptional regulator YafY